MHKIKLAFIVFFLHLSIFSQEPVFIERFENLRSDAISLPTGFSASTLDDVLQIQGNGFGGLWSSIFYDFNQSGRSTLDLSASPKIFIKAKASPGLELRIDLIDNRGYLTNLSPVSVMLDDNFAIYEFDFNNKLFDGAFGGPCQKSPCSVDPSKISLLSFYANPGVGKYNGTIAIDWVSFGYLPSSEQEEVDDFKIKYNQIGYFTGREKVINITSSTNFTPLNYTIRNSNDAVVKTGITQNPVFWGDAQEYVSVIDITEIDAEGTYEIDVEDLKQSFTIGDNVYQDLSSAVLKYYYYNRASTAITSTYGGVWSRASGLPDTQVRIHSSAATSARPTGTIISAPKGWFDAGDYNKYVVNSGISTYTLLAAFEHYKSYYETKNLNIPESGNNLPDILDEIIWNLDWMLTMQDPNDGGVYHKLTGLNFSGVIMPNRYTATRYVVKKSTAAALNFAAVLAQASRVFAEYETEKPGYSATLIAAAKEAYNWAKANPTDYFTNPSDVRTGEYGDRNVMDEFQWAATELFITTKETTYKEDIRLNSINNTVPNWQSVGGLALFSMNYHSSIITDDIDVDLAKSKLLDRANILKTRINNSPMRIGMSGGDYVWGSNGVAANQIVYLIQAYEASKDETYLNAAYKGVEYLLGRNGTGFSFISGFGDTSPVEPHHRISFADGITNPIPGMLAGGPQPGQQDQCFYISNAAAKSYSDTWCSYSTNEVTINWNAPLAYAINALKIYQNEGVALNVYDNSTNVDALQMYPNPVNRRLKINTVLNDIEEILLFSVAGKLIYKAKFPPKQYQIDVSNFKDGVYFLKIKTSKGILVKKILKN